MKSIFGAIEENEQTEAETTPNLRNEHQFKVNKIVTKTSRYN